MNQRLLAIAFYFITNSVLSQHAFDYDAWPVQLNVKFKKAESRGAAALRYSRKLDSVNTASSCRFVKAHNQRHQEDLFLTLFFHDSANAQNLISTYMATGLFEYVEPNFIGSGAAIESEVIIPNDQHFQRQWYADNDGTFPLSVSKIGADIDLTEAWGIQQGNESIIVAFLDSGIKPDHPEFSGRLWSNEAEIINGIDDDKNGYVDDVHGWNFAGENNQTDDDNRHGTHVAGIFGANGDNEIGYAGIDWNSRIMICKVLDDQAIGYYSWWAEGIYYAVDNGARIINMSLGGEAFSQTLKDAVDFANDHGVLIITSMQNDNNDKVYYPAGYENTIAVGSTDPDDRRSLSFVKNSSGGSNYGNHIDVVAPGNYIYGLNNANNSYGSLFGGTSLATPVVTGIAALVAAQYPDFNAQDIKRAILSTSDDEVGNPSEDIKGWDPYYGFGRVNAFRAITEVITSVPETSSDEFRIYPNPTMGDAHVSYALKGVSYLNVYVTSLDGRTTKINSYDQIRYYEDFITFEGLPAGIYLISLESAYGVVTKRIAHIGQR